ADARPLCAEALDRTGVDGNAVALEMDDGTRDRPVPLKAKIAVARRDRQPRHLGRMKARTMQVELRGAETIGPALRPANEFSAQYVAIECVRALPVGDMYDAVVEANRQRHRHRSMLIGRCGVRNRKAPPAAAHGRFPFNRRWSFPLQPGGCPYARARRHHTSAPPAHI